MSDDERPPVGDEDASEADSATRDDDGMGDDRGPLHELPEGVKKEIVTEAPSGNWKRPKSGDEVCVHYVGTLESDGSEFDSSRGRGEPFTFTLGKGQVIKGWDLGVATMRKGEIAKFTLAPEFAYGDAGSPPKIPEKATLVFEVELLSWASRDDLFGDEGVIKTQLKEGSGWKSPKEADEVLLSLKVVAVDGTVIEERSSMDYKLGSSALGSITKACEKALLQMKKGEQVELKCSKDYAYGEEQPGGVTITVSLHELFETKDVSFLKDKSVMKKQVKEGEGYEVPNDCAKVTLSVELATDGSSMLPGFEAKVLEFTAGNGQVCDALECAVTEMKKGERAVLTVTKPVLVVDDQLGIQAAAANYILLTLELKDFENAKDRWSMSEEEKLEFGGARKEVGTSLFKSGRLGLALQRYKKVCELFDYIDDFKEDNKATAKELKSACELNQVACFLKLQDYLQAKTACDNVLKDDKRNVKALYRLAQANFGLKNFEESIRGCKSVVEADPQNREARQLLRQAQASQKEVDRQAKGLFANMCKALGKGSALEPGKNKRPLEAAEDAKEEQDGRLNSPMNVDRTAMGDDVSETKDGRIAEGEPRGGAEMADAGQPPAEAAQAAAAA